MIPQHELPRQTHWLYTVYQNMVKSLDLKQAPGQARDVKPNNWLISGQHWFKKLLRTAC